MGVLDSLLEKISFTQDELMDLGLFLYHPDIFLKSKIKLVKLILFFDESEQMWLRELCEYFEKSEKEMVMDLLLDKELPLYR